MTVLIQRAGYFFGMIALVVGLALAARALAGSGISVGPLSLEISPRSRVAVLEIGNYRSEPLDLQASVVDWRQENGEDRLAPTEDVVVSPAITSVPPGKRQIFRLAFRGVPDPERERAFRVMVADVSAPATKPETEASVSFRVTNSVPLFVRPNMKVAPQLAIAACHAPGHEACLEVRNTGAAHTRVRRIAMSGSGWTQTLTPNVVLLAGTRRVFTTQIAEARPGRFSAQVEGEGAAVSGDIDGEVP
ncbi:MAG: putative pili assembly chaperone transrane protein [Caulobacteraceae bacterium]|nr:putative pili assembly chaperone transrane protein [Caulobacteraceae bacterium]